MAGVAVGLAGVIGLAVWLRPDPRGVGTHQQLGLPPCSFHFFLRVPCPSCGMTTSFAALVRGQVSASLKANAVGTLLAIGCLAMAPYLLVCAVWGKRLWVRDYEVLLARIIVLVMVLVFAGWGIRLGVRWLATGTVKDAPTRTAE
jgi:hypothetical protein